MKITYTQTIKKKSKQHKLVNYMAFKVYNLCIQETKAVKYINIGRYHFKVKRVQLPWPVQCQCPHKQILLYQNLPDKKNKT